MTISDFSITTLTNGAHFAFVTDVYTQLQSDETLATKLEKVITPLKTAIDNEDTYLKQSQKSFYTDDIEAADKKRDELYMGYKKAVEGYVNFPVEDAATAAKVLAQHIKDYGINPYGPINEETGEMDNFIKDLEDKYSGWVGDLSLTPFVKYMKEANELVKEKMAYRTAEVSRRVVGAMKDARKKTDDAYHDLVTVVNGLAIYDTETNYSSFINYMNTLIANYKKDLAISKSNSKKTDEAEKTE